MQRSLFTQPLTRMTWKRLPWPLPPVQRRSDGQIRAALPTTPGAAPTID